MPVDYEAVPRHVEREDMTPLADHEMVPHAGAPPDVSVRAPANRGLAGLFIAGLIFLGFSANGRLSAFGSCTNPAGIRSQ